MRIMSRSNPDENIRIGTIIEVDGSKLLVELDPAVTELTKVYRTNLYAIGQFGSIVKMHFGRKLLFAFVTRLRMRSEVDIENRDIYSYSSQDDTRVLEVELFGEGQWFDLEDSEPHLKFERGVATYPLPQQGVYLTTEEELRYVYEHRASNSARIGHYVGSETVPCYADVDELFGKHTAILGSTGSGKSCTVAAILRASIDIISNFTKPPNHWNPQIVILDPHNEYGHAFPDSKRLVSDEGSLILPYWLLDFREIIDLIIGKTEFQATSQTNIIKRALLEARQEGAEAIGFNKDEVTVDAPIPFSIQTLERLIDADKPSQASKQSSHLSILQKIDALRRDRRMEFLMNDWSEGTDQIIEIVRQFIDPDVTIKIVDLSGIPNDVAGTVSAVISRLLFMYKLWQSPDEREGDPILLVCEEAHRYVPDRGEAEYASAQDAIRRVAKEGRKYGLGIMLVSQRPSELDGTVLSQCNSWVVLRLTNARDQQHVERFLPDSLAGLARMLPSLRRQEAIFLGQAAQIPARIRLNSLPSERLPRSQDISFVEGWKSKPYSDEFLADVARRWRVQDRS